MTADVLSLSRTMSSIVTVVPLGDRKSTRLNSSHSQISYAVFCLKKKKTQNAKLLGLHAELRPHIFLPPLPSGRKHVTYDKRAQRLHRRGASHALSALPLTHRHYS